MKKLILTTSVQVYEYVEELPEEDRLLLQQAKNALKSSYSPYSKFRVGAAVLLDNGEVISGSNQENAAYSMCICAERVALSAAAVKYPNVGIRAIAVTVENPDTPVGKPATPCGACRQVICETEDHHDKPMRIIMQGESGDIYSLKSGKDLLPLAFDKSFF